MNPISKGKPYVAPTVKKDAENSERSPSSVGQDVFSFVRGLPLYAKSLLRGAPLVRPPTELLHAEVKRYEAPSPNAAIYEGPLVPVAKGDKATALSALEALELLKFGELHLTVPMKAGELPEGIRVLPNTMMSMHLKVEDGNIDFKTADVRFSTPLKGPLGTSISGMDLNSKGKIKVELDWLPNPRVGGRMPSNLVELVKHLQKTTTAPVKMLGFTLGELALNKQEQATAAASGQRAPSPRETSSASSSKSGMKKTLTLEPSEESLFDFNQARLNVKNVQLKEGKLPVGEGSFVALGPDNRFEVSGTLSDLVLKGHVAIKDMTFHTEQAHIRGGGTGDVVIRWNAPAGKKGSVTTTVSNMRLESGETLVQLPDGHCIRVVNASMMDATLTARQKLAWKKESWIADGIPELLEANIGEFTGVVDQGQLFFDHGNETSVVNLHHARLSKGRVSVSASHTVINGLLSDLDATLEQGPGGASFGAHSLNLGEVRVTGGGNVDVDSRKGARLKDAQLQVAVAVDSGEFSDGRVRAAVQNGSGFKVVAHDVMVSPDAGLEVKGRATEIDLKVANVGITTPEAQVKGGSGGLQGAAESFRLVADKGGGRLFVGKNDLRWNVVVEDARLQLQNGQFIDLATGARFEGALREAALGLEGNHFVALQKTHIVAPLDSCRLETGNGKKIKLTDATVVLDFNQLELEPQATTTPVARGQLLLQADLKASQFDVQSFFNGPGLKIRNIEGDAWRVQVELGEFSMNKDGTLNASDVSLGVQALAQKLSAQLGRKPD